MSQIKVRNLTFGYEGSFDLIFENVSFQMDTDWKLGFTGRNGRGKTTFLNLLQEKMGYAGSITKSTRFEYFPFAIETKQETTLTIINNIAPDCQLWEMQKELSRLELEEEVLYRPFESLSNGERTKIMLALLFLKDNHFLLIDEPTNHLDSNARRVVGRYLNSKKGFILVSHDRDFLDACVDHILSINKTNIEVQKGNFSSWYANKQRQDSFEQAENEKLKKEMNRLQAAARRNADWSDKIEKSKFGEKVPDRGFIGHKAAKMMKRSKSIESRRQMAAQEKEGLLKNIETTEALKLSPLVYHADRLMQLDKVSLSYDGKTVCQNISFSVMQGDRVALCGKNGCGKTSVLKLLNGQPISYQGEFQRASGLKLSYVAQDTSFLKGTLTEYAQEYSIEESLFKAILRKFDFSREQFDKPMEFFSEGQKKKTILARSLCEKAHVYIWDEPLNYIDVFSRMQLEALLPAYRPTIIFVEHDASFVSKIATKVVSL